MNIRELSSEENLALIGLLKVIIQADNLYSLKESAQLKRVASLIGADLFKQTVDVAREKFKTLDDVKAFVPSVTRQEARMLIFSLLQEMAHADGVVADEEQSLEWLAKLWNIE